MIQTQSAILDYLSDGKAANFSMVQTIKKYRGEIAKAAAEPERTRKFAEALPAVYVCMIDGNPIAQTPEKQFDLFIITEDKIFDQEQKELDALEVIDGICAYIEESPEWTYNDKVYLIDTEKVKVKTLLSDARFIIIAI